MEKFAATSSPFCKSHACFSPPSAKRHPPVVARCAVGQGMSGMRCQEDGVCGALGSSRVDRGSENTAGEEGQVSES